ncbi:MAG: GlsB/YeaQ/YmgE family stress response membrane protein [Bryobacteraceae bacterium]|nr:GlsB/YeaQ/YmgE family stress response membrane protein [Bryobacteraceae bacterium]
MDLLWFLLIGLAAGAIAGRIMKGGGYGLVGDIVVGVIGSMVGRFALGMMGLHGSGLIGRLVVATIGAVILIWLLRFVKRV